MKRYLVVNWRAPKYVGGDYDSIDEAQLKIGSRLGVGIIDRIERIVYEPLTKNGVLCGFIKADPIETDRILNGSGYKHCF